MRFVETPLFTSAIREQLDEEDYRRLPKNAQENLTPGQLRMLSRLVREGFR